MQTLYLSVNGVVLKLLLEVLAESFHTLNGGHEKFYPAVLREGGGGQTVLGPPFSHFVVVIKYTFKSE